MEGVVFENGDNQIFCLLYQRYIGKTPWLYQSRVVYVKMVPIRGVHNTYGIGTN